LLILGDIDTVDIAIYIVAGWENAISIYRYRMSLPAGECLCLSLHGEQKERFAPRELEQDRLLRPSSQHRARHTVEFVSARGVQPATQSARATSGSLIFLSSGDKINA
jgi:hypothetical protein